MDAMHGAHQDAQKSSTTTLPLSAFDVMTLPSRRSREKGGAASPVLTAEANDGGWKPRLAASSSRKQRAGTSPARFDSVVLFTVDLLSAFAAKFARPPDPGARKPRNTGQFKSGLGRHHGPSRLARISSGVRPMLFAWTS